jgi:hypothetical protein
VLTGDGGVATRQRTGGNERRWLQLVVRAEEGVKKLEREGMKCGVGRGVSSPFYRGRGHQRGVVGGGGVTAALMALTPLKKGARLRGGLRGGNDGGRVTARVASEGGAGRRGVARGDEEKRQRSAGVGKGMELTGGPHMAVT